LRFSLQENGNVFSYEFGRDTTYQITKIENDFENVRDNASIFIPAKEVLSLFQIILKSREQDAMFGFDDTYLDLVKALQIPPQKGKNFGSFSHGRKQLEKIIDGNIIYDTQDNQWYYKKGNTKFSINITSEGIKKIAIFNRLLSNKYLTNKSILCIDEIEASLHPKAISEFLDMIFELSQSGIQFFITSHSYFVIKKLYLLALKNRVSIPVLSLNAEKAPQYDNLLEGMPDNSIIDEAIQLYKSEVDISLGEDSDA
jgi:AAA15 family ATPase/GTPase